MIEPHQIEITHQTIAIEKLPAEFRGLRIVQLSDVHHSPFLDEERINEAVRMANDLRPDLVALTGDYISHSRDYIASCARALGRLRAAQGVFAVLGNHDHWTDGAMMRDALADQGIRVLCNESTRIERGSSHIRLAGVDDLMVKRDDLRLALEETSWYETRILLSHNPAIIREAARAGVDLVLSGHTHGGQINWRLLTGRKDRKIARWLRRPSRRLMRGHAQLGSTQLYVNRGLGTVIVPLRYGCPPEITVLEIVRP
jgi:predicted MPP superfamily phosphohydrolase